MQIRPDQLRPHLRKGELAPVYLLAGDEPLLLSEAASAIRRSARAAGFDERQVLHPEVGENWDSLAGEADNLSLFSSKRLIELYLPDKGAGSQGSAALIEFLERQAADTLLLILGGPMDARQRKAAWVKRCEAAGVLVYAWPLATQDLPAWISARATGLGLTLTDEAVTVLAGFGEGNLLAVAQELDRLHLLHEDASTPVDEITVRAVAADSARFDMFDLPAKALAGDAAGVVRSIERLREEGTDTIPILWALVNQIRQLIDVAADGEAALSRLRMPPQKKRLIASAARRVNRAALTRLLPAAAHADQVNKGAASGQSWEELVTLALALTRQCAGGS